MDQFGVGETPPAKTSLSSPSSAFAVISTPTSPTASVLSLESLQVSSPPLLDRISERKRAALVDLNGSAVVPARRRARTEDPREQSEEQIAVQRFTLVSRGAPPAKRVAAKRSVLVAPPRLAAQLGDQVQVCRCSQCDKHGVRRRLSGRRLCRRDTEAHPEYALLLNMSDRFETECFGGSSSRTLVSGACCREKSAYFVLGPGSITVGYVAAEVAANRKARKTAVGANIPVDDGVPTILQVYIEPEFRGKGFASGALALLLRDHDIVRVEEPTLPVMHILQRLGYMRAGSQDGDDGRVLISFAKCAVGVKG